MKTVWFIPAFLILFSLIFSSCTDDGTDTIYKDKISGFVQKGPFLNGTSIAISELRTDLSQSGKTFSSQIKDNQGTFDLSNVQLISPFVALKADGFYYNEVLGISSKAQITLLALADVTNNSTLNVNVLSTLEKGRVETLVSSGLSFAVAKKKAMEEILAIFNLSKTDIQNSELLDINKPGDDNAILLAISVILQGYRSEAQLSEFLANINSDFSTDGKLDNADLQTELISHAKFLNVSRIKANMVKRYTEIGSTSQVPEFEKYLNQFIEKSSFRSVSLINYPETIDGIPNILNDKNTSFVSKRTNFDSYYYLAAKSMNGISLKIKFEYISGGEPAYGYWAYQWGSASNWNISNYDMSSLSQTFELVNTEVMGSQKIILISGSDMKIKVSFYENNDLVPTRTKIITVN